MVGLPLHQFAPNLLQALINHNSYLFAAIDLNYKLLKFNSEFKKVYKKYYGNQVRVGSSLKDLLAPNSVEQKQILRMWDRALHGEEFSWIQEFRNQNNRDRKIYEVFFKPLKDNSHQLIGGFQFAQNITEKTDIRNQLELSEATFRSFFENSPTMMEIVELVENKIVHLGHNFKYAQFFGLAGIPKEVDRQWQVYFLESEKSGVPSRFNYCYAHPCGSKYLSVTISFIGKSTSGHSRFSYVIEDKTQLVKMEIDLKKLNSEWERKIYERTQELGESKDKVLIREAKLMGILDCSPVGLSIADAHGNLDYLNSEGISIWEEMKKVKLNKYGKYQGWFVDTGKKIKLHEWAIARAALKAKTSVKEKIKIKPFKGKKKCILNFASPMCGSKGELIGTAVDIQNITDIQYVEDQLRASEALLQSFMDYAPLVTYYKDLSGRIVVMNQAFCDLIGKKRHEILGKTDYQLFPKEIAQQFRLNDQKIIENSHPQTIEEVTLLNGKNYTFISTQFPLKNDQGQIIAVGKISVDITAQRDAEKAVQQSEKQFQAFITALSEIVWIANAEGKVIGDSPSWRNFTGQNHKDFIGDGWLNAIHPDDRERVTSVWKHANQVQSRYCVEYRLWHVSGEWKWTEARGVPIFNHDQSLQSWVGMNIDITKRKNFEESLKKSEEHLRKKSEQLSLAIQSARIGFYDWDVRENSVNLSEQTRKDWGLTETNKINSLKDALSLVHPDDREHIQKFIHDNIGKKPPYHTQFRIIHSPSKVVWLDFSGTATYDDEGLPVRFFGTSIDITELKQAQEQTRMTLESITDGFYALDREWRFVYVNAAAEKLLLIRREEVMGKNFWEVFPITLGTKLEHEYRKAIQGEVGDFENFYEPWKRWFHNRCYLREGGGLTVYFTDVTETKVASDQLRAQRDLMKVITDNATSCLFMMNQDGYPTFMNPAAEKVTGFHLDEIKDKFLPDVIHPYRFNGSFYLTKKDCLKEDAHSVQKNEDQTFVRKDGSFFPVSYAISPIRNQEGIVTGSILEFQDITGRNRVEKALASSMAKFKQFADAIPQLGWVSYADGYTYWYNQNWYRYTGTLPKDVRGWGWREVHDPKIFPEVIEKWKYCLNQGVPFEMEFPIRGADRQFRWFLTRIVPIKDQDGNVLEWFGTSTDIQEQRQATEALYEALRARDEFLSIASHELKTPLTSLTLQIELQKLLLEKSDSNIVSRKKMEKAVLQINQQVSRLVRLVDDMLDISRIRSGMLSLERKKVNFDELIRDVLERMKSQFIVAGSGFPVLKSSTHVQGDWDAMRIEQVVINLFTNAIRYGAGKPVCVSLECSKSKVWLRVKDQGIGVAKDSQEKIFNRFERAVDAKKFSGLGLGLYISKQIIEAHGGRIWVESEVGKGSTFFVELPLTPPR